MRRVNQPLLYCGAAVLALAGVVQLVMARQSPQTTPAPPQSAPPATPNAAADPNSAIAQRERAAMASFGRGDSSWATAGADAQRSSWVRTDPKISKEGVQKPDFKFLWKLKLADGSSRRNSLTPTILLNRYIGYRGFRDLGFVENNGTAMYGIDIDLGRIEWTVHDNQAQTSSCGPAPSAGMARGIAPAFPSPSPGFGFGRGGPAHSAVGPPDGGAVTLAEAGKLGFRPPPAPATNPAVTPAGATATSAAAPPTVPPAAASPSGAPVPPAQGDANAPGVPGSGGPAPRPPRSPIVIHVLTADGMLHTMYVSNGQEPKPPVAFVPANSRARGFVVLNDVAYAAVTGCNGGPSSILALDTKSGTTAKWDASSDISGSDGLAFGPDGTIFVSTVDGGLFALNPKTLEVKDSFKSDEPFASSPVVFQYRTRVLGIVATRSGSLVLFDTKSLGGDDHKTPLFRAKSEGAQAPSTVVASWMDNGARRWILAPGKAAINAWQVKEQSGALSLEPGWTSREIPSPSAPMVINGVVFAASNADPFEAPGSHRPPSVIYALDGITGKELWNTGRAIASSAHKGSLSGGGSQIYLGGDDGTVYAFGAWIERQVSP